ncbi:MULTISPECIES: hypothetical protein [Roseomonadaceae]|uniref:HEPN AbiU2-like domain-containing protein n=1 Tax=Falsiroseomonas oleicola TaxID=2801474 RepID=A0ABS6H9N1_9PROT|nr:hypothetical protein [Roseomonas oleicola]MBU8544527.1 hypothetical protein [Roseomonas oleicola]
MTELEQFDSLVRRVGHQTRIAIALWEAVRPAARDTSIFSRFNDTEANNTVFALLQGSIWQVALITCRVWDTDKKSASLPEISRLLRKDGGSLADQIANRTANRWRASERRWAEEQEADIARHPVLAEMFRASMVQADAYEIKRRKDILEWGKTFERQKANLIKSNLNNLWKFRIKRLAHFDLRQGIDIDVAEAADLRDLFCVLVPQIDFLRK